VETFADNLEIPWAIDFIDENTALITERPGRLRIVESGGLQAEAVKNTPQVLHEGQGGLLNVAVDPEYERNGWVYLAYSHELKEYEGNRPPAMTRLVRGKIEDNPHAGNGATQFLLETLHCRLRTRFLPGQFM
jgi:glucose/arabinose dehydrogenase